MLNNFKILDSVTDSMAIINNTGEILFTNKAWSSFSTDNMGDESCTGIKNNYLTTCDSVKGEESKMAIDANNGIKKVINNELDVFELEYPCHSPSVNRWFILRVSNISTSPDLTLLAHLNITNRKVAELEVEKNYGDLLKINERLNTTLHKIVHDIQNPLYGIMGLVDLSKTESDTETLNEYLEMIKEGSSSLSTFVKETLKHISTSENIESINVSSLVNNYIETIEPLLKLNSINIKLDINQKGEFNTNEIEFRSIISNLIGNSIKYCDNLKSEKNIIFKFSSDSISAVLKIEDNGIGIKKEDIPKLMQRNFQANKASSDGEGLGMFMLEKSIVKLGGFIKINSEIGVGSEFIIEIPNGIKNS